jgi:uncharacterized membrane protein required for colicin V production
MIGSINLVDVVLPLLLFGGVYLCFKRGFVRTLISIFTLFVAFTVAALLYNPMLGLFASLIGSSGKAQDSGSVVFGGLTLALYLILESMVNRNYPNLRIQRLGNANNFLGGVVGVIWTALALSLILLILEYASQTFSGAQVGVQTQTIGYLFGRSNVVALFRGFFALPLGLVRPLFPYGLPDVLAHFTY